MINGVEVLVSLNSLHLHMQADLLKITMKNNAKFALKELHDLNPITKLW
jgi:hypothetical protein